jgi:hypothetical protein
MRNTKEFVRGGVAGVNSIGEIILCILDRLRSDIVII